MTPSSATPNVFDLNNLAALKGAVKQDDPKALKAAAQQFEALFLQMVLKSMRDATPKEGMFDSDQTRLYESLLDQQLAQVMSAKGGTGLAALIEKQLSRGRESPEPLDDLPLVPPPRGLRLSPPGTPLRLPGNEGTQDFPVQGIPTQPATPGASGMAPAGRGGDIPPGARDVVGRVWRDAVDASRSTGVPAQFLVAHAALETGWGRSEPRLADGRPSYNLFGIKAGRGWTGAVAEAVTTEYVDGRPQRQVERFRAYGSYAEAFRDYASLLQGNPRYAAALQARDGNTFAQALQRGGYATDPLYADKLSRLISGNALRSALQG